MADGGAGGGLGPAARTLARRASRLRWIRKAAIVRGYGAPVRGHLGYVFTDPELDTFSYDLANEAELARAVADVTGDPVDVVTGWFAELRSDDVLAERLARATRGHPEAKRRPPLGRQLARYALVRSVQPALVVECGVKHGLGSLVMVRGLERNEADGSAPARLIAIDPDPGAGWLVAGESAVERVVGRSTDVLPAVLDGRAVGMVVHDSVPDEAVARAELTAALDHAAPALGLAANGGWSPALRDLAAERGFPVRSVAERPVGTFYPGAVQDVAVQRRA